MHRIKWAFGVAVAWVAIGGLLSLAMVLLGEWIFNVRWTEGRVITLVSWVVGAPAILAFSSFLLAAVFLRGNALCPTCNNTRSTCTCCEDCDGSGHTDVVDRLNNWFLPYVCVACYGTGNESAEGPEPDGDPCALCDRIDSGKFIRVVKLSYAGGPTTTLTSRHEWTELERCRAFICYKCGRGCRSEREAEDRIAPKLSRVGWGFKFPDEIVEGGGGTVYWGQQSWDEEPKTIRRA